MTVSQLLCLYGLHMACFIVAFLQLHFFLTESSSRLCCLRPCLQGSPELEAKIVVGGYKMRLILARMFGWLIG